MAQDARKRGGRPEGDGRRHNFRGIGKFTGNRKRWPAIASAEPPISPRTAAAAAVSVVFTEGFIKIGSVRHFQIILRLDDESKKKATRGQQRFRFWY